MGCPPPINFTVKLRDNLGEGENMERKWTALMLCLVTFAALGLLCNPAAAESIQEQTAEPGGDVCWPTDEPMPSPTPTATPTPTLTQTPTPTPTEPPYTAITVSEFRATTEPDALDGRLIGITILAVIVVLGTLGLLTWYK